MFYIDVFDAHDRFLMTVPCPHRLTEYGRIIQQVTQATEREDANPQSGDLAIHYRRLMRAADKWRVTGCMATEDFADLTRVILFIVFTNVGRDFYRMAQHHHVQVALPSSMEAEPPIIEWVITTPRQRQAMLDRSEPDIRQLYMEQLTENLHVSNEAQ